MVFAGRSPPARIQPHTLHDAAKCLIRYQLMIISTAAGKPGSIAGLQPK